MFAFVVSLMIIIIIIADNKSLQQELTSPLTIMQLDKIVKIETEIMSRHLIKFSKWKCFKFHFNG